MLSAAKHPLAANTGEPRSARPRFHVGRGKANESSTVVSIFAWLTRRKTMQKKEKGPSLGIESPKRSRSSDST